jgi:enoyl-CoA hydratase/carnithine racemase
MTMVSTEDRDAVRHLVLNRPEKRNALNGELISELGAAIEAAAADPEVRVVVLRGEGAMFSSGMDLNDLRELSQDASALRTFRRPLLAWWNLLEEMPKPTICQIHGAALGGAFELALACDFRTMAEDAVAGIMEVRIGLLPDVGGCSRLPAVVGLGNAKELIMTGKVIDGREAHRIGFANRIAPAGDLDAATGALANELLACAPRAVGARKARARRGGQAGARQHARAGGRGPGDACRERGLRGGRARLLREARSGLRRTLIERRRPDPGTQQARMP